MMQIRLFSNNLISKDRTPPRCAVLFNILHTNLYKPQQGGRLCQNHTPKIHGWHQNHMMFYTLNLNQRFQIRHRLTLQKPQRHTCCDSPLLQQNQNCQLCSVNHRLIYRLLWQLNHTTVHARPSWAN